MRILNLNQNWKGERFEFRYTTTHYYRVEVSYIESGMSFELKREQLPEPLEKSFTTSLFSDWLISPEDYAFLRVIVCSGLLNFPWKIGTIDSG